MHRLSIVQLLSLWSELEACYYRKNGFGTDTAEIYMYRLCSWEPSYSSTAVKIRVDTDASEALCAVLQHYAITREASIWVDDIPLEEILRHPMRWDHRVHVRVKP